MVYPLKLGRILFGTQQPYLPRTFSRYKSLTAAIERGRGGPDSPSRSRIPRLSSEYEHIILPNRREKRLERFGPPRDTDNTAASARDERPHRPRTERVTAPRRSGFGRERPSQIRNDDFSYSRGERSDVQAQQQPRRREVRRDIGSRRIATRGSPFDDEPNTTSRFGKRDHDPPVDATRGRPFDDQQGSKFGHNRRDTERLGERQDRTPRNRYPESREQHNSDRQFRQPRGQLDTPDSVHPSVRRNTFEDKARFAHPDSKSGRRERERREGAYAYPPPNSPPGHINSSARPASASELQKSSVRDVESLPYTTAASEFVYGYLSVVAALKANRRKLYTLYVHSRGASRDGLLARIRAQKMFSITQEVGDEYLRAMDKASSGRPHNGVILESSPLPVPPVTELKTTSIEDESFSIGLDSQSAEEAVVNGKQEIYSYKAAGWRHPLVLYVDGVLDEGNLGAIARSAYFLGVDAIITPSRQTAPWSHIAVKASAGAAEAIPLFKVSESTDFLGKSSRAGWRIYASDAVPAAPSISDSTSEVVDDDFSKVIYTVARTPKRLSADHSPVAEHPTILMMGAEGTGLRKSLLNLAHYNVGIVHGREVDEIGVDSLNVSVAASLLCFNMLQKPKKQPAPKAEEDLF